jgi:hypothetical protein
MFWNKFPLLTPLLNVGNDTIKDGPISNLLIRGPMDISIASSATYQYPIIPSMHTCATSNRIRKINSHKSGSGYQFDMDKNSDLLKSCHLCLEISKESIPIRDIIEYIEIYVNRRPVAGDTTLQKITGTSLEINNMIHKQQKIDQIRKNDTVLSTIPLTLYFYNRYIPLVAINHHSLHFYIQLKSDLICKEIYLINTEVLLEDKNRKEVIKQQHKHIVSLPITKTIYCNGGKMIIDLVKEFKGISSIREVFLVVKPIEATHDLLGEKIVMDINNIVVSINILLNGVVFYDNVPVHFFSDTVPREYYGLENPDILILPIDFDPLKITPSSSSNVNMIKRFEIDMELISGNWEITVFIRNLNIMQYALGYAELQFKL